MKTRMMVIVAMVAVIAMAGVAEGAATITHVGDDVDGTGPNWRTTAVTKPLDVDGNDVYGTDGWLRPVNNPPSASNPSYLTPTYLVAGNYGDSAVYVDDAALLPGPAVAPDVHSGQMEQSGNTADAIQIDVTSDASFRLGVESDYTSGFLGTGSSFTSVRVWQSAGGIADTGMIAAPGKTAVADWMLFDIVGAQAGDQFIVSVESFTNPWGASTISHAFFDTIPADDGEVVPEPAGLGLIGLALLAVRRKRS